ncbi:hypothetical protein [Winogradskyella haliclonae]|uniref:Uncharacterized protein n=1 Tax=Winogradskyella haliclonae TaxID=2048558 RepID=A0ABQ2BUZ5_9FLAO|nr:hypothetical protein [Winogradskyella haliclonae]GGI56249.1 hypothetical protein GCM10011444_05580 [Winogradskyella haliclonae]
MNPSTKAILISLLIFLGIFILVLLFFKGILGLTEGPVAGMISAVIAALFSPRRTIINKQSGKEVQLKWFFSDRIYIIK